MAERGTGRWTRPRRSREAPRRRRDKITADLLMGRQMFDCSTVVFGFRKAQVLDNTQLFDVFDLFGLFGANCYWRGSGSVTGVPVFRRGRISFYIKSLSLSRTV